MPASSNFIYNNLITILTVIHKYRLIIHWVVTLSMATGARSDARNLIFDTGTTTLATLLTAA